jgi:hypothetical protein
VGALGLGFSSSVLSFSPVSDNDELVPANAKPTTPKSRSSKQTPTKTKWNSEKRVSEGGIRGKSHI